MNVVIAGGGRTGAQLAVMLLKEKHRVRLIENRKDVLARIHRDVPTEVIFEGNPIDPHVLEHAGIAQADIVAAVTASDEQNLVICYIARETYGVQRTIARVNNPRDVWLFDEKFHVDVTVNQADIMARLIEEEMSMGDMMTIVKLRRGNYSLVEEKILPGAKAIGIPIKDLGLPEHCILAGIVRNGEVFLPRGPTIMEAGDEVMAVTDRDGARQLAELLTGSK